VKTSAAGVHTIRTLLTNGKFQGDDDNESDAQFGFSAIPALVGGGRGSALVIGLGTGHSAATLKQLGYDRVDVAEYAPGIVEAAQTCFAHLNDKVLSDPTVKLHLEDGRNLLLADRRRRFDLITIEISSIWFSGSTNLYSVEFFDLARNRLEPGGVLQQWVQVHHIGDRELVSAVASARSAFPYVSFWYFGGQGMIVSSREPQQVGAAARRRMLDVLSRRNGMTPAGAMDYLGRMLNSQLLNTAGVSRLIACSRPILNTDHNRWIEYASPRYYANDYDWTGHNLAVLSRFQQLSP
jgi:spermidine synthase